MSLSPGTRLGPYEVVSLIGAGGMGEVYRATDTKLKRQVAVKVLPRLLAGDSDRLARFQREAEVLASLNHPHIAGIYGLEATDGTQALVMELVEGEDMAQRLARGPIPVDEALLIAKQIAEALEAAHEQGIIHRDLKPANIKVRPDGTVKVLDFGLAKALAPPDSGWASGSPDPTVTTPAMTQAGMILGTAAYMAPEQARGKTVDRRADIWAFGCVLFEMLAGRRPFEGSEVSDTLASVLKSDPDWQALPTAVPPAIQRVIRRCLEKDPRRRFHDIADVRLEIEEAPAQEAARIPPQLHARHRVREQLAWALAAMSLLALAAHTVYVALQPPPALEVTRFQVLPPPNTDLGSPLAGLNRAMVSPDGTRVVFAANDRAGGSQLWIRAFDSFDARPLSDTDGASIPFWSPDSRAVAFFVGNKLRRVDVAGGSAYTICEVGSLPRGGTWGSNRELVFSSGTPPSLYRVSDKGGRPVLVSTRSAGSGREEPSWPQFLPDGRTILYWTVSAREGPALYVASLSTDAAPKKLLASDSNAAYDSGFLLFTRGGALLRQRFDPVRLEVSGEPVPVAESVAGVPLLGVAMFSASINGVLTFQRDIELASQFAWFDRTGKLVETVGAPGKYRYLHLSPDGQRLVYLNADRLWILDLSRQIASKITTGPGTVASPVWSPDGRSIFYRKAAEQGAPSGIYEKSASGALPEKLFFEGDVNGPSQISRDGKWLLYFATPDGQSLQDVYVLPMTGQRTPQPVVQSPFADVEPQLSPDGRYVAYASRATGSSIEVFVQPFPATGERWQVSNSGGRQPLWRQDGKELFFVSEDRKFYAVEIKAGPTFDYGAPRFLFEMRASVAQTRNSYIPSADGKRFLVNMALDTTAPPINVIRNWTSGLKD